MPAAPSTRARYLARQRLISLTSERGFFLEGKDGFEPSTSKLVRLGTLPLSYLPVASGDRVERPTFERGPEGPRSTLYR